jgi:predicted dehydrogenase
MKMLWAAALIASLLTLAPQQRGGRAMDDVRLITLDPGHFHAGLIQKEMYPGVSPTVSIYAPLGFDLTEHLNRIARFNLRAENPTRWQLEVHTGPDYFARLLRERPGNVVIISGRNRGKIERIKASVEAGLNVLADKPWVIEAADFALLEAALAAADRERRIAYDIMTERSEITTILQRELIHAPDVFGAIERGTPKDPAVFLDSTHHILKLVAGAPNIRPAWFFDTRQQGEGLADVATHLVDLVPWMLHPERSIDYRRDLEVTAARRWPTTLTLDQFKRVTNEPRFPPDLVVRDGRLDYYCNGWVTYRLRGVHVKVNAVWNYEPPAGGGDTHEAFFRGSRARVEVRQGREERYRPELYVIPAAASRSEVRAALERRLRAWQTRYPGLGLEERGERLLITIPDRYREGHEAHFAAVTTRFLSYLRDPSLLPAWERPNMLAKYYVTTKAVELSRGAPDLSEGER